MPVESQVDKRPDRRQPEALEPAVPGEAQVLPSRRALSAPAPSATLRALFRRVFSFPALLGMVLVAGAVLASRWNLPDPDLWMHLTTGNHILATHTWPTTEHYSFTVAGSSSIAFEWLGDVIIALAARAAGLVGLMILLSSLSAAFILLTYYFTYQRCGSAKAAFVGSFLILFLTAGYLTLRPQLIGYLFLIITLISLERFRQGRRNALWVLPPLFLVWVNTHGSFILGLLILGLYAACGLVDFQYGGLRAVRWTKGERLRLEIVGLLSVLALAATPYGTRLAGYTLHVLFNAPLGMSHITEYQALGVSGQILKVLLALLLPYVLALLVFRPSFRLEELLLFLFTLYGACVHSRLLFLFAVVFAPLLATMLGRWIPRYEPAKDHPWVNAVFIAVLGLALIRFCPSNGELQKEVAARFPAGAVAYLRQHPVNGPMFNDYGWGGYLIWSMGPKRRVFIDGRSELYEDAGVYADYIRIMSLDPNTLPLIRKYDLEACLIRRDAPLGTLLAEQPGWRAAYADPLSELFIRNGAAVHKR